jgi:hypothetical protein
MHLIARQIRADHFIRRARETPDSRNQALLPAMAMYLKLAAIGPTEELSGLQLLHNRDRGASRLHPSHTTVHTGPYTAVRWI